MKVEELIEILNEVAKPEAKCSVVFAENSFNLNKKYSLNFCAGFEKEIIFSAEYFADNDEVESTCVICGEQESIVTQQVELVEAEYKGYKKEILSYFHTCNICGFQGNYMDMKRNKEEMLAFKKEIDLIIEPEYEI